MIKSMLILTDFSENAFRAAEYACELAGLFSTRRIVLYHAYRVLKASEFPVRIVPGQTLIGRAIKTVVLATTVRVQYDTPFAAIHS
jgi:hypothetical protein